MPYWMITNRVKTGTGFGSSRAPMSFWVAVNGGALDDFKDDRAPQIAEVQHAGRNRLGIDTRRVMSISAEEVTFSSCYGAMLDTGESEAMSRTEANQVSLACLGHGAKFVVASTRSVWISLGTPYDLYGPGLLGELWQELGTGTRAAEALRRAKRRYLTRVLPGLSQSQATYHQKTVLQFQCYGHPEAQL